MRRLLDSDWRVVAGAAGVAYALAGILFAIPQSHAQAWRLAAWAVSGVIYIGHIAHERIRFRSSVTTAAWHVAVGVAIGGLGLAVGANIHSVFVSTPANGRLLIRLALLVWPVLTAVPGFLVALAVSLVVRPRARP